MLTIYRIDHVSQVVPSLAEQTALLEELFGFVKVREWRSATEGCRGIMYELPGSRGQRWELLEPLGEDSPLQAFLDSPQGPGLHHIAVETTDMKAALGELDRLGLEPTRVSQEGPGQWVELPIAPPGDNPHGQGAASVPGSGGLRMRLYGPPVAGTCGDDGKPRAPLQRAPRDRGTLGIRELVHVCQATTNLDGLAGWNEHLLGMHPIYRTPDGKHPDMATMMMTVPGSQIIWELIAPVGDDSFVGRFVQKRGEAACHHVTFEVGDWERAMTACEGHGVPTFGESTGETDGGSWHDAFIHPKYAGGVLVQLYHEELPGVWMRSDKVPAARKAAWS